MVIIKSFGNAVYSVLKLNTNPIVVSLKKHLWQTKVDLSKVVSNYFFNYVQELTLQCMNSAPLGANGKTFFVGLCFIALRG
jgi:hypothetical protein